MYINNETKLPYLINDNCLHIFDPVNMLMRMFEKSYRTALYHSVSSVKIYMFQQVVHYNQSTGTMWAGLSYTEDELCEYTIDLLEILFCVTGCSYEHLRVMFMVNKNMSKKNIRQRLSKYENNPRIIGIDDAYFNYTMDVKKFDRSYRMTVIVYKAGHQLAVVLTPRSTDRLVGETGLNLVLPFYDPRIDVKKPIVTVEDYCKWYDLYVVTPNNVPVSSYRIPGKEFAEDVEWVDHAPNPRSVVEACDKHNMYLDFISYIAICYRWSEDVYEDNTIYCSSFRDPQCQKNDLPSIDILVRTLKVNQCSMCKTYGLPWMVDDDVLEILCRRKLTGWRDMYKKVVDFGK